MKNMKLRKRHLLLMLLLVSCIVLLVGCKGNEKEVPTNEEEEVISDTELLFSFESYEDITKTGIRVGNQIGKTQINHDEQYITDGKGSWMVQPQGDYGSKTEYPYFWMQCLQSDYDTSIKKSDFFGYDKIMLDIYNDSDEEVQIQWNFTANDAYEEYTDTDAVVCTLEPNAWTTCEYDLTGEEFSCFFNLEIVKYMKFTFLTKKNSKDDTVATLYLDNLRGHLAAEQRVQSEITYDMQEGLTFEKFMDQYVVRAATGTGKTQRVSYEEIGLTPLDDTMGEYALEGNVSGAVWPGFSIDYGETFDTEKMLTFMMYVQVNEEAAEGHKVKLESRSGEKIDRVFLSSDDFNQWIEVKAIPAVDAENDRVYFFLNFDNNNTSLSFFESTETVKVYLDNIRIVEKEKEVVENSDGSVTLLNPYNASVLTYTFKKPVKAGQYVSLDIEVDPAQHMAVWLMGDSYVENVMWADEFFARDYEHCVGKQPIRVEIPKDTQEFSVRVEFRDKTRDWSSNKVTIGNVSVYNLNYDLSKGLTFENTTDQFALSTGNRISYAEAGIQPAGSSMGQYALVSDGTGSTWPGFTLKYDKSYEADKMLSMMMYVQVDEKAVANRSVKMESPGNRLTMSSDKFNQWIEVKIILGKDAESNFFFVNFDNNNTGKSYLDASEPVKIYLDNIRIADKEEEFVVNKDGSVTLLNPYNVSVLKYTFDMPVKAGESVVFDIDVSPAQHVAVWLMGDDYKENIVWEDEYYAHVWETWSGKKTILVDIPEDTDNFSVRVELRDESVNWKNTKVTISDVEITKPNIQVNPDGTVTLRNATGAKDVSYVFDQEVKAGQKVSIDIDVEQDQNMSAWIMDEGYIEFGAVNHDPWTGKQTLTATVTKDISKVRIYLRFMDETVNWKENVVTLSNLNVKVPDTVVNADGSVTLRNSSGGADLTYVYDQNVKKGQKVSIDIEVENGQNMSAWIMSEGYAEYGAVNYNPWTGIRTLSATVTEDLSKVRIYVRFLDSNIDWKENVVTLSNLKVTSSDTEVGSDGTVTLRNSTNATELYYKIDTSALAGSTISFDVAFNTTNPVALWILGDGWREYYANGQASGRITDTIDDDVSYIQIKIQYRNSSYEPDHTSDKTGYIATISNISVTPPSGAVVLENSNNLSDLTYNVNRTVKAGSTVSFDVKFNTTNPVALWILGDGLWSKEYFATGVANNAGTIKAAIKDDISFFQIYIQYRNSSYEKDTTSDKTGYITTISNIQVSELK